MSLSPLELIRDETDPNEEIHAIMLASETEDGEQYYIVLRSGTYEGHLMLKERYFVVRPDGSGTYMGNGINRRVPDENGNTSKQFARALARLYARLSNDFNPKSTQSSDASALMIGSTRSDGEVKEIMTSPAGEETEDEDEDLEDEDLPESKRSVTGETPEVVECERCGYKAPPEQMVNFGGGVIDAWIHEHGCPE